MLTIRFARVGKKNKSQYKIVVQEKTAAPTGRHVEVLGSYNPHSKEAVLKEDRIKFWIEKGAQISDSAHNLFVNKGVIKEEKKAIKISKKKSDKKTEGEDSAEGAVEEKKEGEAEAPKEEEKVEEKKPEEAPVEDKKPETEKPEVKKEPSQSLASTKAGGEAKSQEGKKAEKASKEETSA